MRIYHYAPQKLSQITATPINLNHGRMMAQTVMGDSRRPAVNRNGHWGGGAYFFHEHLPMSMIDAVFGDSNPYWPKGVTLYEHTVEVNLLSDLFYYVLDPMELTHFVPGAPGTGLSYPEAWLAVMTKNNFLGSSVPELNAALQRLMAEGRMEDRIRELAQRPDFNQLTQQFSMGLPVICLRTRPDSIIPYAVTPVSH